MGYQAMYSGFINRQRVTRKIKNFSGVCLCLKIFLAIFLSSSLVHAAPPPASLSPQIIRHAYQQGEIISLPVWLQYHMLISFEPEQSLQSISIGDAIGWEIVKTQNSILVRMKQPDAKATNLIIRDTKNTFHFDLTPADKRAKHRIAEIVVVMAPPATELKKEQTEIKPLPPAPPVPVYNYNYSAQGSQDLTPYEIRDDGKFTYIKFYANRSIPVIYYIDDAQDEAIAPYTINPTGEVILFLVAKNLIFRRGDAILCVTRKDAVAPVLKHEYSIMMPVNSGGKTSSYLTSIPQKK